MRKIIKKTVEERKYAGKISQFIKIQKWILVETTTNAPEHHHQLNEIEKMFFLPFPFSFNFNNFFSLASRWKSAGSRWKSLNSKANVNFSPVMSHSLQQFPPLYIVDAHTHCAKINECESFILFLFACGNERERKHLSEIVSWNVEKE